MGHSSLNLLIDAYSLLIRHYKANPAISRNGEHIGAVVGFLKNMERVIDRHRPDRVFVIWEGGGSQKKRSIYSDYKSRRKPAKMNHFFEEQIFDSPQSRTRQTVLTVNFLRTTPVQQVYVSDCEADDVIGYLCKYALANEDKLILSSDHDYYQLLDEKTRICTFKRGLLITKQNIVQEYNISSSNFCLAKAICGDRSDNIPGVRGAGYKTLAKRFPFLREDRDVLLEEIFNYSENYKNPKVKLYALINDNVDLIKRNWKLMYLDTQSLTSEQMNKIENFVKDYSPTSDKIGFIRKMIAEGFINFDADRFFLTMKPLTKIN